MILPRITLHCKLVPVQNREYDINLFLNILPRMTLHCKLVPVQYRELEYELIQHIVLFIFKTVHGIAPSYITSLLSLKQSRYNVKSVCNSTLARSEIKSARTTGDRAFAVAAPVLWNALPPSLRAVDNITSFKKQLKTRIFRKTYF